MFSFSAFGTLGLVYSSEDQADFVSSGLRPDGAGHTRDPSPEVDSLIAVQVIANITPKLSAVLQVMSEQNYDDTYSPHVEWANIKYQFTPDFSIRAGRIVLPAFLVSDYRKVGYANSWLRSPVEVYGLIPVTDNDGVDASYRLRVGEITNTLQVLYGYTEIKLPTIGSAEAKDVWGISGTGEYGAATVHVSYIRGNFTVDSVKPLFDGFRQFGPEGVALADKYDADNKDLIFMSLGGMYDPGDWFVQGEWGSTDSNSAFGKRTAWYASGGYRLGKFTPYFIYARTKAESNTSDPGLTVPPIPGVDQIVIALNANLNAILGSIPVQKTISVGGRWDFRKNFDLKLQYDHTRLGDGSAGTLINTQPGFQPGGTFNVFSVAVDFVF